MNAFRALLPTTAATKASIIALREKLRFPHGNYRLALFWPIVAISILALGWMLLFAKLDEDRKNVEVFALEKVATLSRGYADRLQRTLDTIDQILLLVRAQWNASNGQLRLEDFKAQGIFPDGASFNVSIADRNGSRLTSTLIGNASRSRLDLSDRDAFRAQKSASKDFLYMSLPTVGRISGNNIIQFSRRLMDQSGSFAGIVLMTVRIGYFTADYDKTTLGENGFLGVIGIDGLVRVTRTGPIVHPPGSNAMPSIPEFPGNNGAALLDGSKWFADKRSRYTGWQFVNGYDVIALTGLDEEGTLASYRASRAYSIRTALAATLALAIFTLVATGLSVHLAWRKHQLNLMQVTYRKATEGGHEGFYIARPIYGSGGAIVDFEAVDCNLRGADFFRLRPEEFIGRKISNLHDRAAFSGVLKMLTEAMKSGQHEDELEMTAGDRGRKRCLILKAVRSDDDLAVTLRDITHEKQHVRELERRGNEDALTGLPNRLWVQSYLPEAVKNAKENNMLLGLLFIDLDGFKAVNDTLGHAAGDEVLCHAALRLKEAIRPHDNVVRLGGDEFVVIVENMTHGSDAAHVAERVLRAFQEHFKLAQGAASVGTSIGISVFPTDAKDAGALLQNADVAMYAAKTNGKRNYQFFNPKFYKALRDRLKREAELRNAIEHDQFVMYYQPRVDMATGKTSSMEALVRWVHPSQGLVEPPEFIPLAEETGLIVDLGALVIDKVCAQLARWIQDGVPLVPVSINVSARQFNESDIAQVLSASLAKHAIDGNLIEIELTESSVRGDIDGISDSLSAIHGLGVKLLVDDFGSGYSSLSQLQRLDFDVLKVDQAFTSELGKSKQGEIFFTAIITMAHALGMRVVAEGVENEQQVLILKTLQCDEVQGFYIGHPLSAGETQPRMFQQIEKGV